ncbi:MAG: tryptophan--tRNA ligase [Candidatus Thorarchaeota archaeon SMTZ1-83]|nr:MAG: tryptophan--tRNA ligase [Candidatus Thorarchaeota archaeon SMTZ1-83]
MGEEEEMVVTPWEVKGKIDYDRLIKEFGTERITPQLKQRMYKITKEKHIMLERDYFFSHRDLNWILDEYERKNKFTLYTGRGPSGHTHIGHLPTWMFTKWMQDRFDTRLYFQMTNDEKFVFEPQLSLDDVRRFTYENTLDLIALGFEPEKTFIIEDIEHIDLLYEIAVQVAKKVTFSAARAVFGFDNSMNIGGIWFPAMQAVPAFIHSWLYGEKTPCIIPCAIDQDPYWRVTRDVAERVGFYKPASIQNRFIPGLKEGGKMSASDPMSTIFTTDTLKMAKKKVMNAFTGGRATVEEQRRLGANPDICSVFKYYEFMFMPDDKELEDIERQCRGGEILCGECKQILAPRMVEFLEKHQAAREDVKDRVEEFSASRLRDDIKR